jgi:hypothetical protein
MAEKEIAPMPAAPLAKGDRIPDEKLQHIARETMSAHFLRHRSAGATRASGPEEFYGFRPEDVVAIFLHKHGSGRGVWFNLKDGRVIDVHGRPAERDRSWYVTSAH